MKKISHVLGEIALYSIFVTLSLACATSRYTGTYDEEYSAIVELPGAKDSIYTKANLVFVDVFNNADSVIQFSDKESGVIKGKYISKVLVAYLMNTTYVL